MPIINQASLASSVTSQSGQKISLTTDSNVQRTTNVDTDIVLVKSANKDYAIANDIITVTTIITNNTDQDIDDFNITDTLSTGASFVAGSVKIGSVNYAEYDPVAGFDPPITIGAQGGEMTMSYDIVIDRYLAVDEVYNSTTLTTTIDGVQYSVASNSVAMPALESGITMLKSADKNAVKSGDILTYTVQISNTGTATNTDIIFTDPIPHGTTFVPNSVTVDGIEKSDYHPADGFALPDLSPRASVTVSFKVQID